MNLLAVISVMVLATFPVRAVSLWLFSGRELPPLAMKALQLVPIAILSAICSPLIFHPTDQWQNPLSLIEFWAAVGSIIFARFGMFSAIVIGISIYSIGKFLL